MATAVKKIAAKPKKAAPKAVEKVVMPKGMNIQVRWQNRTGTQFFVEQAPRQVRVALWQDKQVLLWMPWTYYKVMKTTSRHETEGRWVITRVFFSPTKVSEDSPLYSIPMTNIYNGQRPCYYPYKAKPTDNPVAGISHQILTWEQQGHNFDNFPNLAKDPAFLKLAERAKTTAHCSTSNYLKILKAWEKMSLAQVKKLPFAERTTVRKLVQSKAEKFLQPGVKHP